MNSPDDPEAVSAAFRLHRSKLICPSCNTSNKISFSSDGNGKLRFGCQNRIKSCRKSFSVKTMVLMLEAVSPGIFSTNTNTPSNIQTSSKTSHKLSSISKENQSSSSTPGLNVVNKNSTCIQDTLPIGFSVVRNKQLINDSESNVISGTFSNNQDNNAIEDDQTELNISNSRNQETILEMNTQVESNQASASIEIAQGSLISGSVSDTNFDLKQVIVDQQIIIKQQSITLNLLQEQVQSLAKQMNSITEVLKLLTPQTQLINTSSSNSAQPASPANVLTSTNHDIVKTQQSNNRKTYAQIAASRGISDEDKPAAIEALEQLCKRPRIRKTFKKLDRVYIHGIPRQPIKNLKQLFQKLRIRTSAIPSISFLGLQTAEFLVSSDYSSSFKKIITSLSPTQGRFRVLEDYDASKAADPSATIEVKQKLQNAFIRRVHGLIEHNSNKSVQEFYNSWLTKLSLPIPSSLVQEDGNVPKNQIPQDNLIQEPTTRSSTSAITEYISEPDSTTDSGSDIDSDDESDYHTEARSQDISRVDTPDLPQESAPQLNN